MTCTAVIRFFCVVKPIFHHQYIKPKIVAVVMSILWLTTSFLLGFALFAASGRGSYNKRRTFCFYRIEGNIAVIFNYIGSSLVVIAGLLIFWHISRCFALSLITTKLWHPNLQQGNRSDIEEARITKTLVIVVLGFVSCWAPATIIHVIDISARRFRREYFELFRFMLPLGAQVAPAGVS